VGTKVEEGVRMMGVHQRGGGEVVDLGDPFLEGEGEGEGDHAGQKYDFVS